MKTNVSLLDMGEKKNQKCLLVPEEVFFSGDYYKLCKLKLCKLVRAEFKNKPLNYKKNSLQHSYISTYFRSSAVGRQT